MCELVELGEWQSWIGSTQASQVRSEPGEECLYLEPADRMRMRLLVQPSFPRTLSAANKAGVEPVTGLAAPGYWLVHTPSRS